MNEFPTQLFINGGFVKGHGTKRLAQINPATEEIFAEVEAASAKDVDAAVTGAQRAFELTWRDLPPGQRADVLFKIAQAIRRDAEFIAALESRNVGKPISDARDEVALGARVFEFYAGAVTKFGGQTIPVARGGFDFTLRQPMGVVAAIVPWNFPFPIACWKV
ncbi:MAG TPA: aldehyde dehydrogenase family protein, partial [Methylomirabilota bacterium]|nr:aldehyde dehydrogenase family protein [Methylomirabilota bacterium]